MMSLRWSFKVWSVMLGLVQTLSVPSLSDRTAETLRNRIEVADHWDGIVVLEERIHASEALSSFYLKRLYRAAWSNDRGPLPQVVGLVQALQRADREGLDPSVYHLSKIEAFWKQVQRNAQDGKPLDPRRLVDLDLLLTDAFLIYASHLLSGRVNPTTFDSEWHVVALKEVDLPQYLEEALASGRISEALDGLLPVHRGYSELQRALIKYRRLSRSGGWPPIHDGLKLQLNDLDDRVAFLRQRLRATGDLRVPAEDVSKNFDSVLEDAVRIFQSRHGLEADGVVGAGTLAALNVPIEERVRQMELNLERWRWLPQELGERYILINIPSFELEVIEGEKAVLEMRVVVGKTYRKTPVFSSSMTHLVFSPYWHVPPSLAVQDVLPAVQKDIGYLAEKNIKVFSGWGADTVEIDPSTIHWSELGRTGFPFRFRQEPGPKNALGGVKFMFPNAFNVYLHDTPSRELFRRADRSFSSGCIRIEKPLRLAEYVLSGASGWDAESVLAASQKGVERSVRLPESIPVHLLYWTCWVDAKGTVHFRNDVYGRDQLLDDALQEQPPTGR